MATITTDNLVQYWHPHKGGWYYGHLVDVTDNGDGIVQPFGSGPRLTVPADDIREVR